MFALCSLIETGRLDLFDRVITLANENSFSGIEASTHMAKVNNKVFRVQPQPRWNDPSFRSEIEPSLERANTIAVENGLEMLRFEVLHTKIRVRLFGSYFDTSLASDTELDSMMAEAERIARSVGNASMIANALRTRNVWRARIGKWTELQGSIAEQFDLSSVADERLLLTSAVLLLASLLDAKGRGDEARDLIEAAAPTYCAYVSPTWMQYNLSSRELFDYAVEHREGVFLDTDQLNNLAADCKRVLSTL